MAVLPIQRLVRMGQHIFVDALESLADRNVAVVRPVRGKDVVGPFAEQQVVVGLDHLAERLLHAAVPEGERPAAKPEAAGGTLLRAARRPQYALQGPEAAPRELPP